MKILLWFKTFTRGSLLKLIFSMVGISANHNSFSRLIIHHETAVNFIQIQNELVYESHVSACQKDFVALRQKTFSMLSRTSGCLSARKLFNWTQETTAVHSVVVYFCK